MNSSAGSSKPNSGARESGIRPNTGPITAEQALAIARATVRELAVNHNYVLDERPIERPFGWVFFYTTREYLETGDRKYLVPGTAPFVVHRQDGSILHLPTSMLPERAIEIYEAQWQEAQK